MCDVGTEFFRLLQKPPFFVKPRRCYAHLAYFMNRRGIGWYSDDRKLALLARLRELAGKNRIEWDDRLALLVLNRALRRAGSTESCPAGKW